MREKNDIWGYVLLNCVYLFVSMMLSGNVDKNRHKLIISELIEHNNLFLYRRLTERGKKTEDNAVMRD